MNPKGYCRSCQQDVPARRGQESLGQVWMCSQCSEFLSMVWWPENLPAHAGQRPRGPNRDPITPVEGDPPMTNIPRPRVLVEVSGGCAEIFADPGVRVCLIDYDNAPDAEIPEGFRGLTPVLFDRPDGEGRAVEGEHDHRP